MRTCERCGMEIGAGSPEGLCTRCMLRDGLSVRDENGLELYDVESARGLHDPDPPVPICERSFGDYDLLERIGQGGMGIVYKARQRSIGRIVALKVLPQGPEARPAAVKRFQAEVSAAASLQHPNIIAIHDVGCWQGQYFFSMDFVAGCTLAAVARDKPLPAKQAAWYLHVIAEAIHYAHEQGILHRDLKPSNVLVDEADQPRVTDFGLAKRLADDPNLTLTGQVLGTPNYLPPEQAQGRWQAVGRASDVYGLGAILYFLLTSRPPFVGASLETTLDLVLHQEPVSPRLLNGSVPVDLETICLKCLEKEPSRRYGTARILADELGRFLRGEPIHARPVGRLEKGWRWAKREPVVAGLGAGMALILAMGVGGVLWGWQRAEGERRLQRQYAYVSDMRAAQAALQQSNLGMASSLLRQHLAKPGEEDLRGIEWRYLWQASQGNELLSISHRAELRDAVLSPDARYLVTCCVHPNSLVRVWESATGRQITSFESGFGIGFRRDLAFSADGQWLAFSTTNGLALARTADWQIDRIIGTHMVHPPFHLSASGRQLVINRGIGTNSCLEVWNLSRTDTPPLVLTNADASLRNLAFDPTGRLVAYGSGIAVLYERGPIGIWDLETGAKTHLLDNEDSVALTFSPDGEWLAAGHFSGDVSIWRTADWLLVTRYRAHSGWTLGLAFSPDSRWLATGGSDHVIRFWEAGGWSQSPDRSPLKGHTTLIVALSFSADGQKLASASYYDRTAKLWDLAPQSVDAVQPGFMLPTGSVPAGLLPRGTGLVTLDSTNRVSCWQFPNGELLYSNQCFPSMPLHGSGIRVFPRNGLALGVTTNGTVCSWDLQSGKPLAQVRFDQEGFLPAYLSPDSRWLLGVRDDDTAILCDLRAKRPVPGFPFRWFHSYAADFSPDGRWLAFSTPAPDYSIKLWSLSEQRIAATLQGHSFIIGVMRFSPDSRVLASGGWAPDIFRWSIPDGKAIGAPLRGHTVGVGQLAFSPDGKTLVSSGPDGTIRWWNMTTGREMLLIPEAILASGTHYRLRETYFAGQAELVAADQWLVWQETQGPIRLTPLPTLKEIDAIERNRNHPPPR